MARIEPEDFAKLVDMAMEEPGRNAMRQVIEKELLHFDILFALEREGLLDTLTFQGGTCLRLCAGSPRFSEDLDFAGGHGFSGKDAALLKECIQDYISTRYGLEVFVKDPKTLREDPRYDEVHVDTWQVSVVTAPKQRDVARQRIKIEVATIPAYTQEPSRIQIHYPFLPDGYNDLMVLAESNDEIMADKLVSLVNTQRYIRHRDIWDLQWLKQQGAAPNYDLLLRKIGDYRIGDYPGKVRTMIDRLPEIIEGQEFSQQMRRFLPTDTLARTLDNPHFASFLTRELTTMFSKVVTTLDGPTSSAPGPDFTL